jgi:hypothetical protein
MAILHYRVSPVGQSWAVSCEDVSVDAFDGRKDALDAVMNLVAAAKARGDQVILQIDPTRRHHKTCGAEH